MAFLRGANAAGGEPTLGGAAACSMPTSRAWQQSWLDGAVDRQSSSSTGAGDLPGLSNARAARRIGRRPARADLQGACHTTRLSGTSSAAIARLGQEEQATLFMTTAGGFRSAAGSLHRAARHRGRHADRRSPAPRVRAADRVLLEHAGAADACRPRGSRSASCFAQVRDDGARGIRAPGRAVRAGRRGACSRTRHLDRHPLFQVLFTMQHAAVEPLELPRLKLSPFAIERMSVRFDLEVHVAETDDGLLTAFYYSTAICSTTTTIAQDGGGVRDAAGQHCRRTRRPSSTTLAILPAEIGRTARTAGTRPPARFRAVRRCTTGWRRRSVGRRTPWPWTSRGAI